METVFRTAGGVPVYAYPNPSLHSFFLSLFVRAGNLYDAPEKAGTAHFLEHVAIRNLHERWGGELYRTLDRCGMELNAETYNEMVHFYVTGACEHFETGVRVIAGLLGEITLSSSELEAERGRIRAEVRENNDRSSLSAFSNRLVWEGTALVHPIIGTGSAVGAMTRTGLETYRKSVMTPENLFFYVTGNVSAEQTERLCREIERYPLSHAPARDNVAPVPPSFGKRDGTAHRKSGSGTALRFSFDLDMRGLSVPVSDLLYDTLLSGNNGQLYNELSEKRGLIYDHVSSLERYANVGELTFSYEVRPRDLLPAVEATVALLRRMKTELPDLSFATPGYVDNAGWLYDDAREFNFTYAYDAHILGFCPPDVRERAALYRAVTPAEVREGARLVFRRENLTCAVRADARSFDGQALSEALAALDDGE